MGSRKKIYLGTNTKMYKTIKDTESFLSILDEKTSDIDRSRMELFVIPSYTALPAARAKVPSERILLGAQNMCWEEQGQFTGEISPLMLQEIGIDLVMIGHSERRQIFGEQDQEENKKVCAAVTHGFTALLCVGEQEQDKTDQVSDEVLRIQIKRGLKNLPEDCLDKIWIAYEPVWAIGVNGKPASAEYAASKHRVMRQCLIDMFGEEAGRAIPILYGGSVNPQNAETLIQQDEIDGLFIGRSAWKAEQFSEIIHKVLPLFEEKREEGNKNA